MSGSNCRFVAGFLLLITSVAQAEDETSMSFSQQVSETAASIRGEILKSVLVKKTLAQALVSIELENKLQRKAADIKEAAKPTDLVCGEMASQRALAKKTFSARSEVMASHRADSGRSPGTLTASPSSRATMEAAHQRSNKYFCSAAEASQGICTPSADPAYQRMAGADQDAMFLFQTVDGGQTYEGRRGGAQAQAVDALINRIAYGPAPLEPLPAASPTRATPTGRVLSEMERRYSGFLSMVVYSLRQVKASKQPGT